MTGRRPGVGWRPGLRRPLGRRLAALIPVMAVVLAACGVPADDEPRAVSSPPKSLATSTPGGPAPPAGNVAEVICLVRDGRLVQIVRRVNTEPTFDAHLQHLLAGPTPQERDSGLTSALTGGVTIVGARMTGNQAVIDVGTAETEAGRTDVLLAFGQVVCTLTTRADVATVSFLRKGQPLDVPRADGSQTREPLSAADYTALTVPG